MRDTAFPGREVKKPRAGKPVSHFETKPVIFILAIAVLLAAVPVFALTLGRCAELADEAATNGKNVICGRDGWLFFVPELRHLGAGPFWGEDAARVSRAAKPEHADPLPAILAFKEELDKQGVELLLVPVPPKVVIYADMLDDDSSSRIDVNHQQFLSLIHI
jgi:alginate O-acetyltransferase complex protein AlgJ